MDQRDHEAVDLESVLQISKLMTSSFRPHVTYRNAFCTSWLCAFTLLFYWQVSYSGEKYKLAPPRPVPRLRPHMLNLTDFGAIGDGSTVNTKSFEEAVAAVNAKAADGGAQLVVPPGRWLTGPFNVTSRMTLFVSEGATILAVQDKSLWPILPALPSYGRGRELPGPRYGSLIHGQHIDDFVLTGHNGSIDGQGAWWWRQHQRRKLKYTRGRLIQLMWSSNIVIANVTLRNSPFWTVHPYDCTNVTIRGVTILAPLDAPNTDGVDPDSCKNVLVEDSYISVGDDAVAIKSGWDQYGIMYNQPCVNVTIRNIVAHSQISAGVSVGSEMSGGIEEVLVENVYIWGSRRGIRIKTSPGRGGYVRNIQYRNLTLVDVRVGIVIKTDYGEHPDAGYDPNAFPIVTNISFDGVHGSLVRYPVRMWGSQQVPVMGVEIRDMNVGLTRKKRNVFTCDFLQGRVVGPIYPTPCKALLQEGAAKILDHALICRLELCWKNIILRDIFLFAE